MAADDRQPNLFTLSSKQIQITYSTSSIRGTPQLSYRDEQRSATFSGDEIRTLDSEIGRLVTVTLEIAPDAYTRTLTLIVPEVVLPADGARTAPTIRTNALITTRLTPFGGPRFVKGARQQYRVVSLRGTAQIADF